MYNILSLLQFCFIINGIKLRNHNLINIMMNNDKINNDKINNDKLNNAADIFYNTTKIIDSNINTNSKYIYFSSFNNNFNIGNEIKYFINKKTKVYIHIQQLISNLNVYHIGVSFYNSKNHIRYDLRGYNMSYINILNKDLYDKTFFWGYSNKTLYEIIEYESKLEYKYILGIYDCRHYVRNLTSWALNKPTPIWKLYKIIKQ